MKPLSPQAGEVPSDGPKPTAGDVAGQALLFQNVFRRIVLHELSTEDLRIFFHGQWQRAQLLCIGRHGDAFLLGRNQTDETIALRRRALARLHSEGLLSQIRMRSMLRSAAVAVLKAADQA